MATRDTAKASIDSLNVASVTNSDMGSILKTHLADNVQWGEDQAASQSSGSTNITCDFSGKDRINLTRTGGNLNITVSGMNDGWVKWLLITKTAGNTISFANATDVTPNQSILDDETTVLYEIMRKSSTYYARAVFETIQEGSSTSLGIYQGLTNVQGAALSASMLSASNHVVTAITLAAYIKPRILRISSTGVSDLNLEYWTGLITIEPGTSSGVIIRFPSLSAPDHYGFQRRIINLSGYSVEVQEDDTTTMANIPSQGVYEFHNIIIGVSRWIVVNVGTVPAACPFVYVNNKFYDEILKNIMYEEDIEHLDISDALVEGDNIITISEEKAEITFLNELYVNNNLICKNVILEQGDSFRFKVDYIKGQKIELIAKGYYIPV